MLANHYISQLLLAFTVALSMYINLYRNRFEWNVSEMLLEMKWVQGIILSGPALDTPLSRKPLRTEIPFQATK